MSDEKERSQDERVRKDDMDSHWSFFGGSGTLDRVSDAHLEWLLEASGKDVRVASLVLGVTTEELHARLHRKNGKRGRVIDGDTCP